MRAMKEAIKVVGVTKKYGDVLAVQDVNLEVDQGEIFGLLGPNGAGKTTLIRILTGLTAPTSGKMLVSGYDVLGEPVKAKREFGLVPEISNVYVDLTAWENLIFTAKLYSVSKSEREERAARLLKLFGLSERLRSPAKQFSRGMRKKLAIAMALIHKPRILFLDEPTSGLDVQSSRVIRETLRELNKEGVTIFLTTHYIEEADRLCDRVAILDRGKIVALDTPESLKVSIQTSEVLEVSFSEPTELGRELESHCDKIVPVQDGKFRLYTSNTSEIMSLVTEFAKTRGLSILSINTLKPTLEDVFIKYTGIDMLTAERMEQIRPKERKR